jgi:acyl carrier protein
MQTEDVRTRVTRVIADTLGVVDEDPWQDLIGRNDRQWDSVAQLMLMLTIEDEFDIILNLNEIEEARSIADIAGLVVSQVK